MTGMSEYRVMTVNMWADFTHLFGTKVFSHRIHSIEALIDTYHPDVIGAQEVTSSMMKYMDRILREYGICGKQRKSLMNNEANPVLYRKDRFELLEEKTLWLSDTPEVEGSRYAMSQFPRIVTIVTLKNRLNGDTVTFANTHLDVNFASVRQKQAEKLCELLAKERSPICLTGDFNSHEKHDSIRLDMTTVRPFSLDPPYVETSDPAAFPTCRSITSFLTVPFPEKKYTS